MKFYGYIKNSDINNQKELTRKMNIHAQRLNPQSKIDIQFINDENSTPSKIENHINNIIDTLRHGDVLMIVNLTYLGNSLSHILQRIEKANRKNISIYSIHEDIYISPDNTTLSSILTALSNIDTFFKDERLASSAKTRKKNGTKLGRKSGKKTKSMFDKHKKKILKLNDLGVPKRKILENIRTNDPRLKNTSAQALGQYIKKNKQRKSIQFSRNHHPVIPITK